MTDARRRLELVPLSAITGADKNPKRHASEQLGSSIDRFGYVEPVVLDERTGRIVAGHGRVEALRVARHKGQAPPDGVTDVKGEWHVPVLRGWSSRSDAEASAYLLASNRLTTLGGWDDSQLATMLKELQEQDALEGVGFDDEAIREALESAARGMEPEKGETDAGASTAEETGFCPYCGGKKTA
jgi:hypothetical protein